MSICQLVMATALSGEENSNSPTLCLFTEHRSVTLEVTHHKSHSQWQQFGRGVGGGGEKKQAKTPKPPNPQNKCTRKPRSLPCPVHPEVSEAARYQKAAGMRCSDFTPSPLGGYPPNSDVIISSKKKKLYYPTHC